MRDDDALTTRAENLAQQALVAGMRDDWQAVADAMGALSAETGGEGVAHALVAWCDWHIALWRRFHGLPDNLGPEPESEGIIRPGWVEMSTGRVDRDALAVPAPVRWSGQLLAARAAMDHDAFGALLAGMPNDGYERAQYAGALLRSLAALANKVKAGAS